MNTYIPLGFEASAAVVEVCILPGIPSFSVSGMSGRDCRQMESRIRAALKNCGFKWPKGRIIVSLAPAWIDKTGSFYDLPVAMAVLEASAQIKKKDIHTRFSFMGELALDGTLREVPGIFVCLEEMAKSTAEISVIPQQNSPQAALIKHLNAAPVKSLPEAIDCYCSSRIPRIRNSENEETDDDIQTDPAAVMRAAAYTGQEKAVHALELALSGWHPLFFMGAPGCGKTSLVSLAPYMLPPPEKEDQYMLQKIYNTAGKSSEILLAKKRRPFIAPHHSVSKRALTGGDAPPKPGLFSLAHKGILFIDEMNEYTPDKLEALREIMGEGSITLARRDRCVSIPADFLLIAAANPCRCGYALEGSERCGCSDYEIRRYLNKISGALWDRFHIVCVMKTLPHEKMTLSAGKKGRAIINLEEKCRRISETQQRQKQRCDAMKLPFQLNGRLRTDNPAFYWNIEKTALKMAENLAEQEGMTARRFHQLLSLSRTCADWEGSEAVKRMHMEEAGYMSQSASKLIGLLP